MNTCATCRHSTPVLSDEPAEGPILKCRRYPPVIFIDADGELGQTSPDATDVCGEWLANQPDV